MTTQDYNAFSSDYDRFVNWKSRLAYELPFIEARLHELASGSSGPLRVLDSACGTGMHAIALAQRGYAAAGADLSTGMVARARANAENAGVKVQFLAAGFGELAAAFGGEAIFPFDALLCLGNSLPHLLTPQSLGQALADFAACLRPGGLLLIQNRNFDAVLAQRERWMEPQAYREGEPAAPGAEWLFLRFYDYEPGGLIAFNIVTLHREAGGSWQQSVTTTHLRPLRQAALVEALREAGYQEIQSYGSMAGDPFDPTSSGNLIVTARVAQR